MSSRERIVAAIKREESDHVPLSFHIFQGPWYRGPLYWRDQFERAQCLLELGLDPTIDIWLPDVEPRPDVRIKTWREKKGNEILLTKEFHTPAGVLRQTVRETEDWCDPSHNILVWTTFGDGKRAEYGMHLIDDHNVPRRTEPWVKGREDLEKLKYLIRVPDGWKLDEWRMDTERALSFARRHNLFTVARRTIVGDAFQWFCDIPWFTTQHYDDPEFVENFLQIFQDWAMKLVELALEADVDMVYYRGWYETPIYWGEKGFRRFLLKHIEEQAKMTHAAGKLFAYFVSEGQGIYADILRDMESDVLMGIDPRMLHKGDLHDLFATVGSGKSFSGGIDAEVTLASENPDIIDKAVKYAIEALGRNHGLILSAMIFPQLGEKPVLLMIDSWRKYREFKQ
jgi:hypothetical protein